MAAPGGGAWKVNAMWSASLRLEAGMLDAVAQVAPVVAGLAILGLMLLGALGPGDAAVGTTGESETRPPGGTHNERAAMETR